MTLICVTASDDRPLCRRPGPAAAVDNDTSGELCGACLLVMMFVRWPLDECWPGALTHPAERPSVALSRLSHTPWGTLFDTRTLAHDDKWWFES